MEDEVDAARQLADRRGWFGAMYLQTTRAVRDRVAAGLFDNAERMSRFVDAFAGRYLTTLQASRQEQPVPRCWALAFDTAARRNKVILQHLLLGINAHVKLDLAIVAAEICRGELIGSLHDDFMRVNAVLSELLPRVRAAIGRFSPLLDVIDRVGGSDDDEILNFSIRVARDEAWSQALLLAATDDPARKAQLVHSPRPGGHRAGQARRLAGRAAAAGRRPGGRHPVRRRGGRHRRAGPGNAGVAVTS